MFGKRRLPSEFDELSQAISEAILHSKDVQKALNHLHEKKLLGKRNIISLVLNIEVLNTVLDKIKSKKPKEDQSSTPIPLSQIDGKKLSAQEVAFEEYFGQHFDEQVWLKKWRLRLDTLSSEDNTPPPETHS